MKVAGDVVEEQAIDAGLGRSRWSPRWRHPRSAVEAEAVRDVTLGNCGLM